MDGAISQIIERDGRRFTFLRGYAEASSAEIESVLEPVIDMVLALRAPPKGDYYFAGCGAAESLFQTPVHDVPEGAVCACGSTAEEEQEGWVAYWSSIGLPPRDNLVLYNLKGINNRVAEVLSQGGSESAALFIVATGLAHELYHVKHHQRMLHTLEGEQEAHAFQRGMIDEGATLFGLGPELKEAWLRQSRATERMVEQEWRRKHPRWKPSRKPVVPRW